MALLQERISGIDELDALLLVRSDTAEAWTAITVAERLGRAESWSRPALERLCEAELLEGVGADAKRRYAYRPRTPELDATVSTLATLYEEQRADVLRVLTGDAVERIRIAAAKTFAEAIVAQKKERRRKGAERRGKKKNGGSERDDV